MSNIVIKRVYEDYDKADGYRILVDRIWPRGVSKEDAHLDEWLKEIAPTNELRKWYGHKVEKWEEFSKKYLAEIKKNEDEMKELTKAVKGMKKVTLLFGAKDEEHNQAVVLKKWLLREPQ